MGEDAGVDQGPGPSELLRLLAVGRPDRLVHVEHVPAREGTHADWPAWAAPELLAALRAIGIARPWTHQILTAQAAHDGHNVVVSTGTASGKSLGYLLPTLTTALEGTRAPNGRGATALYLAPTKALAHDQLRAITELGIDGLRVATYDGDTATEERAWVRQHAHVVLSNPDLLHRSMLPGHTAWASFLRALTYVVIDECHVYRGLFGSHVANVIRRLRRVAARYGSDPTFILASATVGDPAASAARLIGAPTLAIDDDKSPRGAMEFALWEPPLVGKGGENNAPVRRSAAAETSDLLADLVASGTRTLAFVRSRRGAEAVAMMTRDRLHDLDAEEGTDLAGRIAAYRAGYLPEERRTLEADLRAGRLLGVAATNALELGVDVSGLDAVLIAGWPGTRASMWQQAGRAGRKGGDSLAILIARDDPLDTYLVHHPHAVFGTAVEAAVCDPTNPYVLAPHLAAAAAELPLTPQDLAAFGPTARPCIEALVTRGLLRARPGGWFWTSRDRASDLADLRGIGGGPIRLVEQHTGRVLGTVDPGAAHSSVHAGAVYVHQGSTYVVDSLDLTDSVALAHRADVEHTTSAREITDIQVLAEIARRDWGEAGLVLGTVEVTSQVVAYLKRRYLTGEVLGEEPLDLPARHLRTTAVWWTASPGQVESVLQDSDVPGAAHAAEHASIGLLPLVATCDRWDIGGVSTAHHPDTGRCTSFVYDGHQGGAGFAERGFHAAHTWLTATRDAIASCECEAGCPSCVQSPKCGNANSPLDKAGSIALLTEVLRGADADSQSSRVSG